jgi:hypothetical protein
MKNILNRGFSEEPLDSFIPIVLLIISKLTGNADFPTTAPTLAALGAQLQILQDAMLIVDPVAREEAIKAARADTEQMLDDLADNLESTANMDPVKLATTGFPMRKETEQTSEPPSIPQNPRLRHTGVSGQAQFICEPSDRARSYELQTAPSVDGPWTPYDTYSSTRKMMLSGFERAKDLWVRARAIGPNNTKSGWSNPVSILID